MFDVALTKNEEELMKKVFSDDTFDFYEYKVVMGKEKLTYHFVVETGRIQVVYDVRGIVREANDYYATEPKALELLLDLETFSHDVWEPACGEGR